MITHEHARQFRKLLEMQADGLTDEQALEVPVFFLYGSVTDIRIRLETGYHLKAHYTDAFRTIPARKDGVPEQHLHCGLDCLRILVVMCCRGSSQTALTRI